MNDVRTEVEWSAYVREQERIEERKRYESQGLTSEPARDDPILYRPYIDLFEMDEGSRYQRHFAPVLAEVQRLREVEARLRTALESIASYDERDTGYDLICPPEMAMRGIAQDALGPVPCTAPNSCSLKWCSCCRKKPLVTK